MRRYGRYFWALVLILAGSWLALPFFRTQTQKWLNSPQPGNLNILSTTADFSLVYPIKPKQWLTFALNEESPQLRIITNAHIQPADANALNPNWDYAVRYELLDRNQTRIKSGLYHLHSQLSVYKDGQGQAIYGNYYPSKSIIPLDGRFILLKLQGLQKVAFLRISFEAINPAILETAVRVYVPANVSEHQLATSWLRMSQEQKTKLAESSIHPEFLLSEEEKANLLKHQWQALGPVGIEGTNYQTRTLYTQNDKNLEPVNQDALLVASGLQADAQHYGAIPLPEHGGLVTLTLKALDGTALKSPVPLGLQWFGRDPGQRWQHNAVWTNGTDHLDYQLDGGLLVIRPASPVIVNAYLTTATEPKHDITDALLSVKTYMASVGVDFGILHYQQQPAALRVDVRRLMTATASPPQGQVSYQLSDANQHIIGSGHLSAVAQPSLFDRPDTMAEGNNVSEPSSYFFYLPAQATQLRLQSDTPGWLVNAYNQPYGHTKWQRVPEDAYIANTAYNDTRDQQLAWFPLRAINDENLSLQQAVQWISGQYHPPEDDPEMAAGHYLWQDYLPQGQVAGRYVLTDYTGEEPRADALAGVYCALATNQDITVKLDAFKGLRSISPELIFLRGTATPFSAEFFVNQQKVAAINAMGRQGVLHIPEMALGYPQLRLQTNGGGQWLMNYQAHCPGQRYLKRRVFALDPNAALDFTVQHAAEDELYSARLYSPGNMAGRSQIKVDIQALNTLAPKAVLSANWTYQNRLYDIRPLPSKGMPVLYAQGQTLGNGERFSIPINSDLPAGTYRIRMALTQGAPGYITLSQTKAGEHQQRRFYRETALEAP